MDITSVFETVVPGSNPGESTKITSLARYVCAFALSHLRVIHQAEYSFVSKQNYEERPTSFSSGNEKRRVGEIPGETHLFQTFFSLHM